MKLKKNQRERIIQKQGIRKGYEVLSKGWPDFLFFKEPTKKAVFIEVKRKQKRNTSKMGLSKHQKRMHEILEILGFKVKVLYIK